MEDFANIPFAFMEEQLSGVLALSKGLPLQIYFQSAWLMFSSICLVLKLLSKQIPKDGDIQIKYATWFWLAKVKGKFSVAMNLTGGSFFVFVFVFSFWNKMNIYHIL